MTTRTILLSFPLLLLLVHQPLPTWTGSDWTTECLNRYAQSCRCTWSSGKRLADCQKSSMNSLPLLSNDIQILDMTNNKLSQLGDNAFTKANLINLQKLYLKGCWIKTIHELAFNDLRILIEVDLSHNELETLDPSVFVTNERLRVIKLNNNKLLTVGEFPVLEHVNTVDLSYNSLTNFSFHTFTGARNLKVLDISYNQFQNLNPELFPRLSSLGLRGNAWVCDCELKPLRDYVIVNKFYETDIRCSEPLSLFNLQWDGFGELSCKPEIMHILANGKVVDSIVAMENTLVLSCVVKGDPTPDVKWVKNGRVVNEAVGGIAGDSEGTVILNLTVSKHDNEFVCVGSNSGGVVERNLTVTVDEAGLSGFVVFKDGGMHDRERAGTGNLVIYLVIGVVFLSLVVGLVVGGVCVWRWGARRDRDGVVKGTSVVKGVNTGGGDVMVGDAGGKEREGGGAEEPAFEQTITFPQQQHHHHHYTSVQHPQTTNHQGTLPRYTTSYSRVIPSGNEYHRYATLTSASSNAPRYYDYDDTTLTYRKHAPTELYDTVVYTSNSNRNSYTHHHHHHRPVNSPDICDLIVPPPPPPPSGAQLASHNNSPTAAGAVVVDQQQQQQYAGAPPPPLEFCECNDSNNATIDQKVNCLQDFRTRVIMISGGSANNRGSPGDT